MNWNWLLMPPIAFVVYVGLVWVLKRAARALAGAEHPSSAKAATYGGGEAPPKRLAAPGYRQFFVAALFFAILHLGMLVLATGELSPIAGLYTGGLLFALIALILG